MSKYEVVPVVEMPWGLEEFSDTNEAMAGLRPEGYLVRYADPTEGDTTWLSRLYSLEEKAAAQAFAAYRTARDDMFIANATVAWDEYGENATRVITLSHANARPEHCTEYVGEIYTETRCHHSYDCCGQMYSRKARMVHHDGDVAVFVQALYRNI